MYTRIHVDASQNNLGTHVPLRHLSPIQPSGNGNGNGSGGAASAIADTTTAISSATTRSILFMTPISLYLTASFSLSLVLTLIISSVLAASLLLSLSLAFVQCRFVSRTLVQISTRTSYSKSSNREKEGVTQNPATERTNELLKIQQEKERMSYSKSSKRER